VDEEYTVYFDTAVRTVPYSAGGAVVPTLAATDFILSDGASSANGPSDPLTSGPGLRSGNPGQTSRITLAHPLLAPGHVIASLSMSYRWIAGYSPAPGAQKDGAVVSVLLASSDGEPLATLYTSSPLTNYSYDQFTTYSPPELVHATAINLPNDQLVFIAIEVANHQRNLQLPLDDLALGFNCTVTWHDTARIGTPIGTPRLAAPHGHRHDHLPHASPLLRRDDPAAAHVV